MQTVAARVAPGAVDRALGSALARDAEELPETIRQLRRRFPEEPYRQRLGAIAERVRRTRTSLIGEPGAPHRRVPRTPRPSSASSRSCRTRSSPTGCHASRTASSRTCAGSSRRSASTSRRSRSASMRRSTGRRSPRSMPAPGPDDEVAGGVTLGEVLATFRSIARLQARFGVGACDRYVISFTTSHRGRHPRPRARPSRGAARALRPPGPDPRGPARRAPGARRRPAPGVRGRAGGRGGSCSTRCSPTRRTASTSDPAATARRSCSGTRTRPRRAGSSPRTGCSTAPRRRWSRRRAGTASASRCSTGGAAPSDAAAVPRVARSSPRRRGRSVAGSSSRSRARSSPRTTRTSRSPSATSSR